MILCEGPNPLRDGSRPLFSEWPCLRALDDMMCALHGLRRMTLQPEDARKAGVTRIVETVGKMDRGAPGA